MSQCKQCDFMWKIQPTVSYNAAEHSGHYAGNGQEAQLRRDSARRRSLRSSRLFNVTGVSTNRKPVRYFPLVNNTNLNTVSHCFPLLSHSQYRQHSGE